MKIGLKILQIGNLLGGGKVKAAQAIRRQPHDWRAFNGVSCFEAIQERNRNKEYTIQALFFVRLWLLKLLWKCWRRLAGWGKFHIIIEPDSNVAYLGVESSTSTLVASEYLHRY
ncbi:hypothetical protein V6N12_058889 [Hibiscus sabdariffa]|uniref:Uncharacterized protein n=1 Tax=Hibiscus sabdariffa TaxID=183260 RepID=A0ABR2EVB3_9ROSI